MAIKAECPVCHRKQAISNKLCECGQVEGYQPRPFGCTGWVHSSAIGHVSPGPPFHPGQSNFSSPVGDHGLSPAGLPTTIEA